MGISRLDSRRRLKKLGLLHCHPMPSAPNTHGISGFRGKPRSRLIIINILNNERTATGSSSLTLFETKNERDYPRGRVRTRVPNHFPARAKNFPLPILLSICFVVFFLVVVIAAEMTVAAVIVALVALDSLALSLVPRNIAIWRRSPRPVASTTSTSPSTDTAAQVVRDFTPSSVLPMASSSHARGVERVRVRIGVRLFSRRNRRRSGVAP